MFSDKVIILVNEKTSVQTPLVISDSEGIHLSANLNEAYIFNIDKEKDVIDNIYTSFKGYNIMVVNLTNYNKI